MNIYITEKNKSEQRKQYFKENDVEIFSRSGLHPTEFNLFKKSFKESDVSNSLFINNRTGALPCFLKKSYPDAQITVLNIDYHHYQNVNKNIKLNKVNLNNLCQSDYTPEKKLTSFVMQIDSSTYSKEYYEHIFYANFLNLKKKGKVIISLDKRARWFEDFLKELELPFTLEEAYKNEYIMLLRKRVDSIIEIDFNDNYSLTLPNKPEVKYFSLPGVFAHHRVDSGALALIDIVKATSEDIVFDMGCGVGTVGLALAKYYNVAETIFVDSNVRALDCCKKNVEVNELQNCKFHLSDEGAKKRSATIFVGNPPYFSNFRIADLFIDTAYDNLKRGGKAYIVGKNILHIHRAMMKVFNNADIVQRRGYSVVISEKIR